MYYPNSIEQKLGFDKIRTILMELCISTLGRNFVAKMRFTERYDLVVKMANQTAEMKNILAFDTPFPSQNYFDVTFHLNKLSVEGTFLIDEEFFELLLSLKTIQDCIGYLKNREENQYPNLLEICTLAFDNTADLNKKANDKFEIKYVIQSISKIIDERGKLKDNASDDLLRIRKAINSTENELRKKLDSILKLARNSGWITDDFSLTVRNGRMVIPIAAEHKRKIKGFIHDESDTGKPCLWNPPKY